MAQNGPIMDHTAETVALTSALRDSVAANAGETLTVRKPNATSPAIRDTAAKSPLVMCLFMVAPES
jgi:hypothetical protein